MIESRGVVKEHGAAEPSAVHTHQTSDDRWYPLVLAQDEITGAIITIDSFHHEIHEGEAFIVSALDLNVADDGTVILHITPGPTFSHLIFTGSCGGDATIEFLEDPQITGGAAVSERNMKRTAAEPGDSVVLENPTINVDGNLLFDCLLPGGTGGNAPGGILGLRPNSEWILNPSATYAVRLTNISGNAKPACLILEWYEESDN